MQRAIDLLEEAVKLLKKSEKKVARIGDTIELAGRKWTILDKNEDGYLCIGESIGDMRFGDDVDWRDSQIREKLAELAGDIEDELEIELPWMHRDLTTLSGSSTYGDCYDKLSMLTFDEYRKYSSLIPLDEVIWTITANHPEYKWVVVVNPGGAVNSYGYANYYGAVRPVCRLPLLKLGFGEAEQEETR